MKFDHRQCCRLVDACSVDPHGVGHGVQVLVAHDAFTDCHGKRIS